MPSLCYVNGCGRRGGDVVDGRKLGIHRMPRDYATSSVWIENINRPTPPSGTWKTVHVCGRHFVDGKPTKENPYPVLHMGRRGRHLISAEEIRQSPEVDGLVDIRVGDDRVFTRDEEEVAQALLDLAIKPRVPVLAEENDGCHCFDAGRNDSPVILSPIHEEHDEMGPATPSPPPKLKWPNHPPTPEAPVLKRFKDAEQINFQPPSFDEPSDTNWAASPMAAADVEVDLDLDMDLGMDEHVNANSRPSSSAASSKAMPSRPASPLSGPKQRPQTSMSDYSTPARGRERGKMVRSRSMDVPRVTAPATFPMQKSLSDTGPSTTTKPPSRQGKFLHWKWFDNHDDDVKYYTGLPDYATMQQLFKDVAKDAAKLSLWEAGKLKRRQKPRRLALRDELLITLIRLRHNFDNIHLGHIFGISDSYVSRLLAVWIPFLGAKLRSFVMWIPRQLQEPVPCFKLFPRCVGVIDCFELRIEKPGSKLEQQDYWSSYKHHHTIKYLVCISQNGTIMYISPAYGGRTSDVAIVQESKEGFLKELMHGDVLLGDRGFTLREFFLLNHSVQLLIPRFLSVSHLSRDAVNYSRRLSSARIHVERVIGELRNFDVLSDRSPVHMLDLMDDIAIICAAIVNMNPPIVSMSCA